jgi:hypothetical protein
MQREITASTGVSLGYVGSHAYHLTSKTTPNSAIPQILADGTKSFAAGLRRRNPLLGTGNRISSDAHAWYNSLQVEVVRRFSHGLQGKVGYAFSKNMDEASAWHQRHGLGDSPAQDPDDRVPQRGLSAYNVSNNLKLSFNYEFPWTHSPVTSTKWLGGWQVGGILSFTDGTPITILAGFNRARNLQSGNGSIRPNLKPGASNNPVLGGPDRYFDVGAVELQPLGSYGNLGRNTLLGPGFVGVDFNLVKVMPVTERLTLDFRAEFFNLLNRANFGVPDRQVFLSNGDVRGAAGRITDIVDQSRQIQFGLKLSF